MAEGSDTKKVKHCAQNRLGKMTSRYALRHYGQI